MNSYKRSRLRVLKRTGLFQGKSEGGHKEDVNEEMVREGYAGESMREINDL